MVSLDGSANVYVVSCVDGSLYTGFAVDVDDRVGRHNDGRGARYTRSRGPVVLRWTWRCRTREDARRLEGLIKQLTRRQKEQLTRSDAAVLGSLLCEVAARRGRGRR